MSFVYPQFLFGLLALAIPIIIHLFNFRRTKKIYFSNNLFLKNVKEATTSKLKVKHLLILFSRLLFITFLVLTFAQPFIPSQNQNKTDNSDQLVYIYLDNSQSMSSEVASNLRGIDLGVNYIEEITKLYPKNTRYKLLTNEFNVFSRVPKSDDEILEQTTEIALTGAARTLDEVHGKIVSDLQTGQQWNLSDLPPDIYWITDFQKSTFGDISEVAVDTSYRINVVPISSSYRSNVFVDSVYLANPFMLAEERNELNVIIRNDGPEAVEDLIVRLLINGQQVANASSNIIANGNSTINFTLNFPLEEQNKGQLVFEDFPVVFDNEFFFTLNLGDKISVLEIRAGNLPYDPEKGSNIANVYANEAVFNFSSYSINNLDYSLIADADLLVLNEIGGAANNSGAAILPYIQDFLANDGHILYIPPPTADIAFLRNVVGNSSMQAQRIENTDTIQAGNVELREVPLANLDLANPFFADMFESENERFQMPMATRLINHNLRGEALLAYETGEPYLLSLSNAQMRSAGGQVYLFTTPLRQGYTNLYRHAIFVPIMYRLASLSKSLSKKLYHSVEETTIAVETDNIDENEALPQASGNGGLNQPLIYELVREDQNIIPVQRQVGSRLLMDVPQNLLQPGFYNLKVANENGEEAETPSLQILSFNIDKKESLIDQYEISELQTIFDNYEHIKIYEATDVDGFVKEITAQKTSLSLWKYALLLALLFLLTEILLIRFL